MADDEVDELYGVKPEEFTALRTRLAAAAKDRGDKDTASRISASRKPTTAAWVVNLLVQRAKNVKQRLTELGERLRAAHAAMDGESIRQLSAEQRNLVTELARDAFDLAELTDPSAALRDDVTDTLHAAIADPDVAARLGRLTKAERYSGFGQIGDTAAISATRGGDDDKAEESQQARAVLAAAERAKTQAGDELSGREAELAAARKRRDDARELLRQADDELSAAADAFEKAKQASRDAAEVVNEAKARVKQIRGTRRH